MSVSSVLWLLTIAALLFGMGQMYLTLIETFPIKWVFWHSRSRKPTILIIVAASVTTVLFSSWNGTGAWWMGIPLMLQALMLYTTFNMHQENMFPADDFPECTEDLETLPLNPDDDIAVIEVEGETKAYPLQYVIHHHIVNDYIGNKIISLSYCAMCRTVIAFDVSDLGPLYVGSFKNANMVVGDRKTRTLFQQATFESVLGPLHPSTLKPFPCQMLPWHDVLELKPQPKTAVVTEHDLRDFILPLPIPGLWKRLMKSDKTPGLFASSKDRRYPARTRVIGFEIGNKSYVCLKKEVIRSATVDLPDQKLILVSAGDTVNGFADTAGGNHLKLSKDPAGKILDENSGTRWDPRGKYQEGPLKEDLQYRTISDEYWFSWMQFHQDAELLQIP